MRIVLSRWGFCWFISSIVHWFIDCELGFTLAICKNVVLKFSSSTASDSRCFKPFNPTYVALLCLLRSAGAQASEALSFYRHAAPLERKKRKS